MAGTWAVAIGAGSQHEPTSRGDFAGATPAPLGLQPLGIQLPLPKQLDQNLGKKHFSPLSIYNLKETDSQT